MFFISLSLTTKIPPPISADKQTVYTHTHIHTNHWGPSSLTYIRTQPETTNIHTHTQADNFLPCFPSFFQIIAWKRKAQMLFFPCPQKWIRGWGNSLPVCFFTSSVTPWLQFIKLLLEVPCKTLSPLPIFPSR